MLQSRSQLIGLPILSQQTEHPIARIHDLILDFETGQLLGVETNQPNQIISETDFLNFKGGLTVPDASVLVSPTEILRIHNILNSGINLFRHPVKTEKGLFLGNVEDFWLNLNTARLTQLKVVRSFWFIPLEIRLISVNQIVKITSDAVIVKSSIATQKEETKKFVPVKKMA